MSGPHAATALAARGPWRVDIGIRLSARPFNPDHRQDDHLPRLAPFNGLHTHRLTLTDRETDDHSHFLSPRRFAFLARHTDRPDRI
jgi:hypothetical protein